MLNNTNDPNYEPVTVILVVGGTAETLAHGEVLSAERFRSLVRDASYDAFDRDPDPTKAPKRRGKPGLPVTVTDIDEETLLQYADAGGPHPEEFERRRVFDTLSGLSTFLGLGPTACRAAMYYAQSKGKKEATVRGVTFMLLEEAPE